MARAANSVLSKSDAGAKAIERCDDQKVGLVVRQLRQICRDSSLEFALKVGAVVIHNFYDGELGEWRSRGPKLHSFRRLAEHPDLPLSPSALYRAVAIFELCQRLNAPSRWRQLGTSHFRVVLGLDPEIQDKLLARANQEQWSVKALALAALDCRTGHVRKGGRKPMSALTKHLSNLQRCAEGWQSDLEATLNSLGPDEIERGARLLNRTRRALDELARALERRAASRSVPPASLRQLRHVPVTHQHVPPVQGSQPPRRHDAKPSPRF